MLIIGAGGIIVGINNLKVANEYIIPHLSCFCKRGHFANKYKTAQKLKSDLQILLQLKL